MDEVDDLKAELWSNILKTQRRPKRSMTKPFVFTMGFLAGVLVAVLVGHFLFG